MTDDSASAAESTMLAMGDRRAKARAMKRWMEQVRGQMYVEGLDLWKICKNGVELCHLLNHIKAGTVDTTQIMIGDSDNARHHNVDLFRAGCLQVFGVMPAHIIKTTALDGTPTNHRVWRLTVNLYWLHDAIQKFKSDLGVVQCDTELFGSGDECSDSSSDSGDENKDATEEKVEISGKKPPHLCSPKGGVNVQRDPADEDVRALRRQKQKEQTAPLHQDQDQNQNMDEDEE